VHRLLRRGADTLTDKHRAKIEAALQAGDPDWEVTIAWHSAQRLRAVYHAPTPAAGRALATQLLESLPTS
jgi:transposase